MKIIIETPFTEKELKEELRKSIEDDKRKGLLPVTDEEWERLNEDSSRSE